MSAVPQLRPGGVRRRRRHGGALLAAIAYGVAAVAVYQLVAPALGGGDEPASGVDAAAAPSAPGEVELGTTAPGELLSLRAVAARVQQSVYTVRVGGTTRGSGFVGWVYHGKVSFVLTAREAVAGAAAGEVVLERGGEAMPARVVLTDAASGLALLRVNTALDRPLWQQEDERAALTSGERAVIVPAGKSGAFGQGSLARGAKSFSLQAGGGPRYLGAPVLADDGSLAGIVVQRVSSGESRIVSLADACRRIRSCG
jgi:S1-C subfamily serine protease